MNIVLTICSANYLAHAKVLGDSLTKSNPDYQFVIGLVDRVSKEIDLASWMPYEVIPVESVGIPEFPEMSGKYDVVELNTAVKPFYLEFLYRRNPAVASVMYLDPDILVLGSFRTLTARLQTNNLVLTPHSCTYDNSKPNLFYEMGMLRTGIYNLGFIATARTQATFAFLKWWQKRLVDHCYYRPGWDVFVDQQWVSLAPLYFDGVYVEKDPGYNMCYWNHFERCLSRDNDRYMVNGQHELVFYHFSNYNPLKPGLIGNRPTELIMTFSERPDLRPLYDDYGERLLEAGYASIKLLKCAFGRKPAPIPKRTLKAVIRNVLKKTLMATPSVVSKPLKRATRFIADNSGS
jgi:uncharacterized protein (DUF2237 family)